MRHITRNISMALAVLGALAGPAAAQDQGQTPAASPAGVPAPGAEQAAAQPSAPTPLPAAPPEQAAGPTLEERLAAVEIKAEGLTDAHAETRGIADKLAKLKLSGYVQGRYEWHQDSHGGVDPTSTTAKPLDTTQFFIRRGRLKALYEGTNAEYMLQIDATGSGVVLKDAEATFVDTWTPANLRITVGQFKWPFGYEITQSSADREMPERSLIIRTLFPGERDRGLRLTAKWQQLRFAAALVNGTGTQDKIYVNNDSNSFKDVVGRVGVDFGSVVGGISGYYGRKLNTTLPTATAPAAYGSFTVMRVGADLQSYIDVPGVGGLALKGEAIYATDTHREVQGAARDPNKDLSWIGWIATAVQNVGNNVGLVFRADQMRAGSKNSKGESITKTTTTLGGGLLYHVSSNLKATMTYEHLMESGALASADNDVFTAQLQARF